MGVGGSSGNSGLAMPQHPPGAGQMDFCGLHSVHALEKELSCLEETSQASLDAQGVFVKCW